jgi:5'-3' exonuclease
VVELIKGAPTKPYLLIDGDIFLYRCGFATEKMKYLVEPWDNTKILHFDTAKEAKAEAAKWTPVAEVWSRREVEPVENALEATRKAFETVCRKFWPGETWQGQVYLTGKGNFRDQIEYGRGYKDNRDPSHRPKHYKAIKEYMIKNWGAKLVNGMEADDAIGLDAYSRPIDGYVVISNDKDLDQISGFHYDWTKDFFYYVNDEDSLKVFYRQVLCGDSTDNIPGIMSPAKAEELIDKCRSPEECAQVVRDKYMEKYGDGWGEQVDAIAELVWIRKVEKEPDRKLYNPFWDHYHAT